MAESKKFTSKQFTSIMQTVVRANGRANAAVWGAYRVADAALGKTGETCIVDGIVVSVRGQIAHHMGCEVNTLANNLAAVRAWTPALLDKLSGRQVSLVACIADQGKRESLVESLLSLGVQIKLWQSAAKLVNDGVDTDAAALKALDAQNNPVTDADKPAAAPDAKPADKPAAVKSPTSVMDALDAHYAKENAAPAAAPATDPDAKPNTPSKSAESAQASDAMLAHLLAVREMLVKATGKAVAPALQHLDAAIGIRMDELAGKK